MKKLTIALLATLMVVVTPIPAEAEPPTCQAGADSDPDGDGWGWENGASCRMPASGSSSGTSSGEPSSEVGSAEPADSVTTAADGCDYSNAGQNGGWGWNATTGESCQPAPANNTGTTDSTDSTESSSTEPADSDTTATDGCDYSDAGQNGGWGWNATTGEGCPPLSANNTGTTASGVSDELAQIAAAVEAASSPPPGHSGFSPLFYTEEAVDGVAELTWNETTADGFLIERNGELYANATGTSFVDAQVAAGQTYEYRITAWKVVSEGGTSITYRGSSPIRTVSIPVPNDPDLQPVGVSAAAEHDSITLSFTTPDSANPDGYRVRINTPFSPRHVTADTFTYGGSCVGGSEGCVTPNQTFTFEVSAFKYAAGESAPAFTGGAATRLYGPGTTIEVQSEPQPAWIRTPVSFSATRNTYPITNDTETVLRWQAPDPDSFEKPYGWEIRRNGQTVYSGIDSDVEIAEESVSVSSQFKQRTYTDGTYSPGSAAYTEISSPDTEYSIRAFRLADGFVEYGPEVTAQVLDNIPPPEQPTSFPIEGLEGVVIPPTITPPSLELPQSEDHPSLILVAERAFPDMAPERREQLIDLLGATHYATQNLNSYGHPPYGSDLFTSRLHDLLVEEGFEPEAGVKITPLMAPIDALRANQNMLRKLVSIALPRSLAEVVPGFGPSGSEAMEAIRRNMTQLPNESRENRANRFSDNFAIFGDKVEALGDSSSTNDLREVRRLADEQARIILNVDPGAGELEAAFRHIEDGPTSGAYFTSLWNASSYEERIEYLGFDVGGWLLARDFLEIADELRVAIDRATSRTRLFGRIFLIVVTSIVFVGAGQAVAAYIAGGTSTATLAVGGVLGSYAATIFLGGSTSEAENAAWRWLLNFGMEEIASIPVASRTDGQKLLLALMQGGVNVLDGKDFLGGVVDSLGAQYIPGLAGYFESLPNVGPFAAQLGADLVELFIRHGNDSWDLILDELEQRNLDRLGDWATNYVGSRLPPEWGLAGDAVSDVVGVVVAGGNRADVIAVIAERGGEFAGITVGDAAGGRDGWQAQLADFVVATWILAEALPESERPGYMDRAISGYLFEWAAEWVSTELRSQLIQGNNGQSSPTIELLSGLAQVTVANLWRDPAELRASIVRYLTDQAELGLANLFGSCLAEDVSNELADIAVEAAVNGNSDDVVIRLAELVASPADGNFVFDCGGESVDPDCDNLGIGAGGAGSGSPPSGAGFGASRAPSQWRMPSLQLTPDSCPGGAPASQSEFEDFLLNLDPSAIARTVELSESPLGSGTFVKVLGFPKFDGFRLQIPIEESGNHASPTMQATSLPTNWVNRGTRVVTKVRSGRIIDFVTEVGSFKQQLIEMPPEDISGRAAILQMTPTTTQGESATIITPLNATDLDRRLRVTNTAGGTLGVIEARVIGGNRWVPISDFVSVERSGGEIVGFSDISVEDAGDLGSAFASLVLGAFDIPSSRADFEKMWGTVRGCWSSVTNAVSELVDFLASPIESIVNLINAFPVLLTIFAANPSLFVNEILRGFLRVDQFNQIDPNDPQSAGEWQGRVLCDLALMFISPAAALKIFPTVAKAREFFDEVSAGNYDRYRERIDIECNSFPADTLVLMADRSYRQIDSVRVGERVTSYDTDSGQWTTRRVLDQWSHPDTGSMATISLVGGGEITSTDGHEFWVNNKGDWVEAGDVSPGDYLLGPDGVTEVAAVDMSGPEEQLVWELDTAVDDNFVVSTPGGLAALVHNAKCPISQAEIDAIEAQYGPTNRGVVDVSNAPRFPGDQKPPEARDANGNWVGGWEQAPSPANWLGEIYDLGDRGYAYALNGFVVRYNLSGYPDFTPYAIASVDIGPFTGSRGGDFRAANTEIGRSDFGSEAPQGFTWHHLEASDIEGTPLTDGGGRMELVDEQVHSLFTHSGGIATTR